MPKKTKRKDENQKPLPRAEHDKRALKKQHNVKQQTGWGINKKKWRKRGFELALGLERAGNHCWNSLMRSANARRSGRRRAPDAAAAVECLRPRSSWCRFWPVDLSPAARTPVACVRALLFPRCSRALRSMPVERSPRSVAEIVSSTMTLERRSSARRRLDSAMPTSTE